MRWRKYIAKRHTKKVLAFLVMCTIVVSDFRYGLMLLTPDTAEAAQVTIDPDASINGTSHLQAGSQTVFINDQTGYKFFRDAAGSCVYKKTSDGGASWGSVVTVDAQTDCIMVTVWYDKWTPGDTGTNIHIATLDTSLDDIFYNRLDTNGDTLLMGSAPVSMVSNTGQGGTIVEGANTISITRGTDGTIYAVSNDAVDAYIVECTTNCNLAASWTETGTSPLDAVNDYDILVPLTGGDIMVIDRDLSLDDVRSKIWNNTTWSAAWTIFDTSAADNTTYDVGMAATVSSTTPGTVYLAYIASSTALGTDDEVRTARYSGGTWTPTTDVITATTRGLTNVAIGLDAANDDVYVAYTGRTTAGTANTGNVYWKSATSSMVNWGTEQGPVNTTADDLYGLDLNRASDQRLHVSWFDNTDDDIYGDTIADIFPGIHASSTGAQITSTIASTTNVYMGGAFLLYNTYRNVSYDVTGITITESGTVDGSTALSNIKLLYEMDTVAPYDCQSVSYNGTESQFGSTDSNGFSGVDGISSFTGTTVTLSTTTAMCAYVVMDVLDTAVSNATIDISINNPTTDVIVTNSTAWPALTQNISGTTLIYNDTPTLSHYHWRNDDGSETTATSKTGGTEDTSLTAMRQGSTTRLRIEVSNEGSTSTPLAQYRLEYAPNPGTCDAATGWTDVGNAGGDFDISNSANLSEGGDTTNIAVASGGVTDENTTFLTPNGGVRDTSSQTGGIRLTPTQFVELEYSIIASTTATEGNTYCFRVTDQGYPLYTYTNYPRANISSDVLVTIATSTQVTSTTIPATNFYVGSAFVVTENTGSRTVTEITISENGTVDAQTDLMNSKLFYDLDTSSPYDCGSESYTGVESQFGATDTDGFSGPNGTSTFTGSAAISTTATMCLYTVLDTASGAQNGETIDIIMENPSTNLLVSGGGSVSPTITRDMNGSTTLIGAVLTQTHYHWRNDNGSETLATSLTGGLEDTPVANIAQTTPVRLRLQISNEGGVVSTAGTYNLEYGPKITTCSAVGSWTDLGAVGGAWDMFNSANITEGGDITNIAVASGGVTDENTTFLTPNSALKDISSRVATTTLSSTQFIEAEFSIQQTADAGFDTTYCFRLTRSGNALDTYTNYAELTTSPERDFEIQRGTATITGASVTLTAGVDYVAPFASTSAFIRITNSHYTGAGDAFNGGTQNANDVTAYIVDPSNILTSVTIARPVSPANDTRISWEIVEFIGTAGSDNEMIVRAQTALTYGTADVNATGTTVSTVTDDTDVVVFITGQLNPDIGAANYNTGQSTSEWDAAGNVPVFTRGEAGGDASIVSYAVVEFTGPNWIVQRNSHTYTTAGTTETEAITAVSSLSRTFIHTQKRNETGLNGTDEFGHEVWLSSIGFVSYFLETGATTPSGQTSVAWIIENTQTTSGAMDVTRSNGSTNGGAEPLVISIDIGKTLTDISNTSLFVNTRGAGTGQLYPRPIAGATIASTTHYELWRSDTGATLTYRTEVVEWPTAGLALRQNYYRLYVDNNALDPTDPWPAGGIDIGENTILTSADEPLGEGERIRIRMSLQVLNATLPTSTKAFRLEYAPLTTTCSAISDANWSVLGDSASSTVWRGFAATGTTDGTALSGSPPTIGDLNLSVSDVAGTLEEINDSAANPYSVPEGNDVEYDWIVQQNGASAGTYYCFRMIESNGDKLGAYLQYPQIRTASFTPRTQNWRWFDDEINTTPTTSLAAENVAPINISNTQVVVLRVTVKEIKNIASENVRFKLQYSEYADFSTSTDVVATTSCIASSTWCYANGAGVDNAKVSSTTLTDADSCVAGVGDGCGTYNESPLPLTGYRHENNAAAEYSFTIQSAIPHVNTVYYFRLYDLVQDLPVTTNTGEAYPSLVTEGASLTFTMQGVASSTVTEGVTTDVSTTGTTVPYGKLVIGNEVEGAQRLTVTTNAPEGYQIYMMSDGNFLSASGDTIDPITSTNAAPLAWSTGCNGAAPGCFGYHAGDDNLDGGSTRFFAADTYARFSTTSPDEVVYGGGPVTNDSVDMIYKVRVLQLQEAGLYTAGIRYIAVPVF